MYIIEQYSIPLPALIIDLIDLDILEDSSYESTSRDVTQCTAQESHVEGDQEHIPEIKAELQRAVHRRLENVIVDAVEEDVNRSGCTRTKGSPLPEVVFCVQTEIYDNDGCHANHNGQNGIDTEQKAVYVVEFVIPERRQHVVKLNENGTETQKSCQWNQSRGLSIPWYILRDGSWDGIYSAWEAGCRTCA